MSLDSNLKVGVVGTGFIGPAHVEALRRLGIEVAAVADNNPQGLMEKAAAMRIARVYDSIEAMVADPSIQVVHIASPNYFHYPHAKTALLAGKHVICEKPLAMNSRQSAELVELAERTQRINAVNFNIRFYPLVHQARSMIQSGQLGQVYLVQGSYLQDWLLLPTDWNWRLEPELGGDMRAVGDIGSHWLDMVSFITGLEVEAVCADFSTFITRRKKPTRPVDTFGGKMQTAIEYVEQTVVTEDCASVLLHFKGGARGVFTVSQLSAGRKNRISYEISCSASSLAWDGERPNELWIGHRERPNELLLKDPSLLAPEARQFASYPGGHIEGFPDTFKQLYTAVYRYIEAGSQRGTLDFPTFADGHKMLVVGDAILSSAKEARWVEI